MNETYSTTVTGRPVILLRKYSFAKEWCKWYATGLILGASMDSTAVVAIVAALIGAGGAMTAVLLTFRLNKRSISDKEQLRLWRVLLDRPAFRGPYSWKSNPERYDSTITIVIEAINTGQVTNREGLESQGLRGKGRSQLRDENLRDVMEKVVDHLLRVRALVRKQMGAKSKNPPENLSLDEMKEMDRLRDEIISTMNESWSKFKISTLKLPTEVVSYEEVYDKSE
ncbi:MAG TPA: hypothetical protein VIU87_22640 [Mycobacterium sp.]